MGDTVPRCDAPDCSTDNAVPGSSGVESQAREATSAICGLSRRVTLAVLLRLNVEELRLELGRRGIAVESNRREDMSNQLWDEIDGNAKNKEGQGTVMESDLSREVSLAVLPRLHEDELSRELRRRKIVPAAEDSQAGLMKRLCDEMGKEYFGQQVSSASLGTNTRNSRMQDLEAPAEQEERNEAAPPPIQEAPSRAIRTTDEELTLEAPTGAEGIGDGGVKETLGEGQMHKALSLAVDTENSVMFVKEFMSGTDINVGAGPSMGGSLGTSFGAAFKRKQESNPRMETPTKRSNRLEETAKEDNTSKVATTERPWVEEPMTVEEEPSLSFGKTSKSGEVAETGAGPGPSAITEMYDAERLTHHSPQPHVQWAGDSRWNCPECSFKARSESSFNEHFRGVHLREKQFKCHECGWRTAWKSNLSQHMKKQHPKSAD